MEFYSGKKRNEGMPLAGEMIVSVPPYGVEEMESRVTYLGLWRTGWEVRQYKQDYSRDSTRRDKREKWG